MKLKVSGSTATTSRLGDVVDTVCNENIIITKRHELAISEHKLSLRCTKTTFSGRVREGIIYDISLTHLYSMYENLIESMKHT